MCNTGFPQTYSPFVTVICQLRFFHFAALNRVTGRLRVNDLLTCQTNWSHYDSWLITQLIKEYVLVMENASTHHSSELKEFVSKSSYRLVYLSPYLPFSNSIKGH
jgi:hypothetical protein